MAFIKVTQIIGDFKERITSTSGEILNWVNSDNVDRIIESTSDIVAKTKGTHICFVSGTDIEVKESVDEILKQIPEGN